MKLSDRLRAHIRAWLGIADAAPANDRPRMSIHQQVLVKAGEKNIVYREFKKPDLLPGVVPEAFAYDAVTDVARLGPYIALDSEFVAPTYSYANQQNCGLGFPGYAYLAELSQRSEYRAPSETIAAEMTREWIKVIVKAQRQESGKDADGDGDIDGGLQDKVQKLTEALEEFKVRDHFRKIAELDGFFGRAQLFVDVVPPSRSLDADQINQLPLVIEPETIKKGSVQGFKVVEPIWTTPYTYNANNPLADDFYEPKAWFVLGKRVHASRLLTFVSREVPDILKPAYNFGGLSMTQLMETDVFQWLRTRNSVSDLIHNFSVMCLQTDMSTILTGEPDAPGGLADRAKLFTQYRDNQGLTVLDKDKEALAAVNVPLGTLDKLQAQAQEHMAAPSHIPLVKLLGITPTGLNASSEGEIQVFYDFVKAMQQSLFADHLNTILQILQLHLFGVVDDAISFEFVSLKSPSVKELAEIRKADAETDAIYIDKGVIAPEETRKKVAADPQSGYNNLSGEPPQPPNQLDAEHGFELSEEGAENAHGRAMEAQAQERKAA